MFVLIFTRTFVLTHPKQVKNGTRRCDPKVSKFNVVIFIFLTRVRNVFSKLDRMWALTPIISC